MRQPSPETAKNATLREIFWDNLPVRIGFLIGVAQIAILAVLTVYYTVVPPPLPENATAADVWRAFGAPERALLIGCAVMFLSSAVLVATGFGRIARRNSAAPPS